MNSQRAKLSDQASPASATPASPVALGMRTGPIGRGVRLFGAVVLGLGTSSLLRTGIGHFRQASATHPASVWILTAVVAILITDLVVRFLPVRRAVRAFIMAALVAAVIATAAISQASSGSLWGPPLSDFIWWVDVADLSFAAASLLLAVPLGTPGCEKIAWVELYALLRAGPRPAFRWCIGGLHVIDNWEIGRRLRHARPDPEAA
jgi:hypothetical protein